MIKKQVNKYERKKGTGIYTYRINVNIKDNLDNEVYIYNPDEYNQLQDHIKNLEKNIENQAKEIEDLTIKINGISEIHTKHNETIEQIINTNNENIEKINKDHNKQIQDLTTLNQLLIAGIINIKQSSFIDLLTNKPKQIANQLIKDNDIKKIPTFTLKQNKE